MAYAPDYGIAMLADGMPADMVISFSPFQLSHVSMLAEGGFTTSVNVPIGEVLHALTVDFSPAMLGKVIAFGPDETAEMVLEWAKGGSGLDTLELPEPIEFDISLTFGEPQNNDDEDYVPLVAQDVFPAYALLEQYQEGEPGGAQH